MAAEAAPSFTFSAQTFSGDSMSGTIDAASAVDATQKLNSLKLRVTDLEPAISQKTKKLSTDDFQTFNSQLAYLATAGLPIENSLRLIAQDMRNGPLAQTIQQVVQDMESGRSLPEAFALHSRHFPPLYSELVNAGIRTRNLPGMLLGLSRHLDLNRRLRGMLWRAISYPLMVFVSLLVVTAFLGICVFPQFKSIFHDFKVELPTITQCMIEFSDFLVAYWPILLGSLITLIIAPPLLLRIASPLRQQQIKEILLTPLPLIGVAVHQNLLARWCDALKLGVDAGLDLPASITLAGQAVGSPRLIRDGERLIARLSAGLPIDQGDPMQSIPPTVRVVIENASKTNDLPSGLNTLSLMFQQQAEMKISLLPGLLTPILIIALACIIGFVIIAMFAPMIALISSVSGPQKN